MTADEYKYIYQQVSELKADFQSYKEKNDAIFDRIRDKERDAIDGIKELRTVTFKLVFDVDNLKTQTAEQIQKDLLAEKGKQTEKDTLKRLFSVPQMISLSFALAMAGAFAKSIFDWLSTTFHWFAR